MYRKRRYRRKNSKPQKLILIGFAAAVTIGAFFFGGLMTLPLLLAVPVPGMPQATDLLYLLILACIMSALTYVLYFGLVASLGATRAISVEFAVTTVAVAIGALALGEPLSLVQVVGALVIVTGCAVVLGLFPVFRGVKSHP